LKLTISPAELQKWLDDEDKKRNLLIVDTRSFSDYSLGHVPRAINMDIIQFHWIDTSKQGIVQFAKQMKILLSNIGVEKNKHVVFYDDISGSSAARGVWLLLYFSHKKVAMLDGGFKRWKKEGYSEERKSNPFLHSNFLAKPNNRIIADSNHIKNKLKIKSGKVKLVDSRSQAEFQGTIARAARSGHIPGAMNIDWIHNIEDHSFKEIEQLNRMYSIIPKNSEIITYCQGGYRAANTFVVLKMLGYKNVRMYLGSWGEWGNKLNLPVEQ
jgi:thiosulfate/3-mercaptopyruvate sulfurtransferase